MKTNYEGKVLPEIGHDTILPQNNAKYQMIVKTFRVQQKEFKETKVHTRTSTAKFLNWRR